jgi:hypothetical protein
LSSGKKYWSPDAVVINQSPSCATFTETAKPATVVCSW